METIKLLKFVDTTGSDKVQESEKETINLKGEPATSHHDQWLSVTKSLNRAIYKRTSHNDQC